MERDTYVIWLCSKPAIELIHDKIFVLVCTAREALASMLLRGPGAMCMQP